MPVLAQNTAGLPLLTGPPDETDNLKIYLVAETAKAVIYTEPGRIEFVRKSISPSIEITKFIADETGSYCVFRQPGIERFSFDAPAAVELVLHAHSGDQTPAPIVACPVLAVAFTVIDRVVLVVIVAFRLPIPVDEGSTARPIDQPLVVVE